MVRELADPCFCRQPNGSTLWVPVRVLALAKGSALHFWMWFERLLNEEKSLVRDVGQGRIAAEQSLASYLSGFTALKVTTGMASDSRLE